MTIHASFVTKVLNLTIAILTYAIGFTMNLTSQNKLQLNNPCEMTDTLLPYQMQAPTLYHWGPIATLSIFLPLDEAVFFTHIYGTRQKQKN